MSGEPSLFSAGPEPPHRAAAIGSPSAHQIPVNVHGDHRSYPFVGRTLIQHARCAASCKTRVGGHDQDSSDDPGNPPLIVHLTHER